MSCWKHRRRSYLGEQFRQICDPPTIELLHGFDEEFHARYRSPAAETHRKVIDRAERSCSSTPFQ